MGERNPKFEDEKSTTVASSSVLPQWIDLPGDVTANILRRLDAEEILESAQKVCTTWRSVCQDPAMWRVIHTAHSDAVFRRAVDLSQGQLLDCSIQDFCDDDLLNYIVDRSSHLKRLTLQDCLTREGLVEALKKLAHLEELHLIIMPRYQGEDIINIGISCPILKSFTFDQRWFYNYKKPNGNEYALAIANSMPNLCHLCLIANPINNDGLEAILDGCPNLESLDLRQCYNLDLQGALGKRCSEQIKHLKFLSNLVGTSISDDSSDYDDYGSISDYDHYESISDYDNYGSIYDYDGYYY